MDGAVAVVHVGGTAKRVVAVALVSWGLATACSSLAPGEPSTTQPPDSPTTLPTAAATTDGLESVPGGFDITRVRLMDPADLPEGVPVPVPFGGEIDTTVGAFEGELLAVIYDGRFFPTAAAFYATWIEMEGLEASPLFAMGGTAAGWELVVDHQPVRIELSVSDDGANSTLLVYWGS